METRSFVPSELLCGLVLSVGVFCSCGSQNAAYQPQDCEFGVVGFGCAPNPDATGDAGSNYDGSSSETTPNTDTVSNDTVEVDAVQVVCKDYLYLITGETWSCTMANETFTGSLYLELSTTSTCNIHFTGGWIAPADTVSILTSGELQYNSNGVFFHTCTKVK